MLQVLFHLLRLLRVTRQSAEFRCSLIVVICSSIPAHTAIRAEQRVMTVTRWLCSCYYNQTVPGLGGSSSLSLMT